MIVGTQKPFPELWEMVQGFKKVLVFGCNTCVAICHAGGGKEAEILATMLRMKAAEEGVALEADHDWRCSGSASRSTSTRSSSRCAATTSCSRPPAASA